jgi:hypothetical protein
VINGLSKDKLKEFLEEELDFGTYEISDFKYQEKFENYPYVNEELKIIVSNYATITGKRLFINPNIMTRNNRRLADNAERRHDIELDFAYTDTDSVEIELPDDYEIESMPDPVSINTVFGKYECRSSLNGRKLKYFRRIEHASGRFPATAYSELVKFYEAIYRADRVKIVLLKK